MFRICFSHFFCVKDVEVYPHLVCETTNKGLTCFPWHKMLISHFTNFFQTFIVMLNIWIAEYRCPKKEFSACSNFYSIFGVCLVLFASHLGVNIGSYRKDIGNGKLFHQRGVILWRIKKLIMGHFTEVAKFKLIKFKLLVPHWVSWWFALTSEWAQHVKCSLLKLRSVLTLGICWELSAESFMGRVFRVVVAT